MTNEQSRNAFEAWATQQAIEHNYEYMSYLLTRHPETGDYNTTWVDSAWMGWQASRESLVIELPKPYAIVGDYAACGGDRAVWDVEYAEKITDRMCEKTAVYDRAGLEAAGLKVSNQ
jgi:hypothetical protein